jgi:hypothetical protein
VSTSPAPDPWQQAWAAFQRATTQGAGGAGLADARAAFEAFAADYVRLARLATPPAGRGTKVAELAALWRTSAARLVEGVAPTAAASGTAPAFQAALAAWAAIQAGIATDTAERFAARLVAPPRPATLRAAFDAFIDCAEAAFHAAARTDAFAAAQARLLNELVRLRAEQQRLVDQTARLAGLPVRAEVDALYDSVRALGAELAALKAAARPAARAPKVRPARRRGAPTPPRRRP